VVTLEGVAANEAEEEMIETDTWCVVGVERVINRLQREDEPAKGRHAKPVC
jgi:osmotically-inducible protein OsmY